jgi:hypothetical protein
MGDGKKGFVYVLTNPSFRDDWVKIGRSKREPEVRGRELYNTAVPLPYEIYATLKTAKYQEAEKMLHRTIDRISKLRIAANRIEKTIEYRDLIFGNLTIYGQIDLF